MTPPRDDWDALRPGGRFVAELGGTGNVRAIVDALEAELAARGTMAATRGTSCRSASTRPGSRVADHRRLRFVAVADAPDEGHWSV